MRSRIGFVAFVVGGLAVALGLAFVVSPHASSEPDGLNRVAIDEGFDANETEHPLADLPTAGYAISGVDDGGLGTGVAGAVGVAVTFAVVFGAAVGARQLSRRRERRADPSSVASPV